MISLRIFKMLFALFVNIQGLVAIDSFQNKVQNKN